MAKEVETQKILHPNILLTAFCGTSAESLVKSTTAYKTLILPNDKIKDSEKLIDAILVEKPDYVISFGQRPNIKDKVHIETKAKDREFSIGTNFDYDKLKQLFEQNGIVSKISNNAGTSFCNQLYLNGLKYISQNKLNTKMVFVHIPFEKNISDFESFSMHFAKSIKSLTNFLNMI